MSKREAEQFAGDMTATAEAIDALATAIDSPVPEEGLVDDLPEERYHGDPCVVPSLSAGLANVLLQQSPAHAFHRHPRLGGAKRAGTSSQKEGTALHALLLEGADKAGVTRALIGQRFEVVSFKDFRTKEARLRRDTVELSGAIALTPKMYAEYESKAEQVTRVADAIRMQLAAHDIVLGPGEGRRCEVSAFWQPDTPHGPIQCRGRFDQLTVHETAGIIEVLDLKKIRSASPRQCERHIEDYGYAVQRAAYVEAIETLFPDYAGRVKYRWAFVEGEAPYVVTPAEPDGELVSLGERRWERAKEVWARCLQTDNWPGYVEPGTIARLGAVP